MTFTPSTRYCTVRHSPSFAIPQLSLILKTHPPTQLHLTSIFEGHVFYHRFLLFQDVQWKRRRSWGWGNIYPQIFDRGCLCNLLRPYLKIFCLIFDRFLPKSKDLARRYCTINCLYGDIRQAQNCYRV